MACEVIKGSEEIAAFQQVTNCVRTAMDAAPQKIDRAVLATQILETDCDQPIRLAADATMSSISKQCNVTYHPAEREAQVQSLKQSLRATMQ